MELLEKSKEGILGSAGGRSFSGRFSFRLESISLKRQLEKACGARVDALFLMGAYNPFIRKYPFPPLHLNLNYLIDPRALLFDAQFNRRFDEHIEGPAVNRADGLVLPGVSQVVFHPNRHPRPSEETPWWKTLLDFYRGEDDEDEE